MDVFHRIGCVATAVIAVASLSLGARAQGNVEVRQTKAESPAPGDREQLLLDRIDRLERRLGEIEARLAGNSGSGITTIRDSANEVGPSTTADQCAEPTKLTRQDPATQNLFGDLNVNFLVDGYYSYNFNHPVGRINLLRAYDVMSNSFSLNQAAVLIERAPDVKEGRRLGMRFPGWFLDRLLFRGSRQSKLRQVRSNTVGDRD